LDKSVESAMGHRRDLQILVVEDDLDIRDALSDAIELAGYRVLVAEDSHAALVALDAHEEIGLVLTDVVMAGGIDGYALADKVIAKRPKLRVLVTSGHSKDPSRLGPHAFLQKPYRIEQLLTKIAMLVAPSIER
jgi:DNA-binding NtrC family response regulator